MKSPVGRAIWFIESMLETEPELELGRIANHSGVSRHHLVRAFGTSTGLSVIRYVRKRRLSEAAKRLCNGTDQNHGILSLALDAGYNSHEAFTRAFRTQFGITPEAVRTQKCIEKLDLQEAITVSDDLIIDLKAPRIETHDALEVAGLSARFTFETNSTIPALWQRFIPYIGEVPGQIGGETYGVCYNGDNEGSFDYMCAVAIAASADLPSEFKTVKLRAGKYAVFRHEGHISGIRATCYTIWNKWLPESGHSVAPAPDFERYSPDFNPETGSGFVEIWIPLVG